MRSELFQRCDALDLLGVEHGFGTLGSDAVDVPGLTLARQVHGARVLRVPPARSGAEADALFTSQSGAAVGVRTADCVPLLLVDEGRRGVAAVHAGWRGSAVRIAERAALAFAQGVGAEPRELFAIAGPHIGPCCYEVDDPVRSRVADEEAFRPASRAGHYFLDLYWLNRHQLLAAGVSPERILRVGGCTACEPELYASYRRDGSGERMLHYVRMPLT